LVLRQPPADERTQAETVQEDSPLEPQMR